MEKKNIWLVFPLMLLALMLSGCRSDATDSDNDGVPDYQDQCPSDPTNTCLQDTDDDGIPDVLDNCPLVPNPDQLDSDGNSIGDACEGDWDGDGVDDEQDNCPLVPNPDQADADGNGVGDACEGDWDGDGVDDEKDNCPLVFNPNQRDSDGDGIGDACRDDADGDGVPNDSDNCPAVFNPAQTDTDGDGVGDVCQEPPVTVVDTDNDGIPDDIDNCPAVPNPGQEDMDGDGVGDACDDDIDGDGVPNNADNCPYVSNADQDATACDLTVDTDGDGIPNGIDNCETVANPGQEDADGDGKGDACDTDFSCRDSGTRYKPILTAAGATVDSGTSAMCLGILGLGNTLCSVSNQQNLLDGTVAEGAATNTSAQLNTTLGLLGAGPWISAQNAAGITPGPSGEAGFVVSQPDGLLSLSLFGNARITFYHQGKEVRQVSGADLILDLLGLFNDERQYLLAASISEPFDKIRLDHRHYIAGALTTLNVHAVCYAE